MWEWIIPLLLKLLVEFLIELFKRLFPDALDLAATQEAFVNKVWWRFWLGPKRCDWARSLHAQAVKRYAGGKFSAENRANPRALAEELCSGLMP